MTGAAASRLDIGRACGHDRGTMKSDLSTPSDLALMPSAGEAVVRSLTLIQRTHGSIIAMRCLIEDSHRALERSMVALGRRDPAGECGDVGGR